MKFRPIREEHSVDAVGFIVAVDQELSPVEIEDLKNSADEGWIDFIPSKEIMGGVRFILSPGRDAQPKQELVEWPQYARKNPDGTNSWELRFLEDQLILVCRDYTRWNKVWPRSRGILHYIFSKVPQRSATRIVLEFGDTFFVSDENTYDLRDLLSIDSSRIPIKVFDYGKLWHLHQGWFSEAAVSNVSKHLHQLKIDATINDRRALVRIQHTVTSYMENPVHLGASEAIEPLLDGAINHAHDCNKDLLSEILTDPAQQRISLNKAGG